MTRRVFRRIIFCTVSVAILGYALLWLWSVPEDSVQFGVSFSPAYAASLGVDWREAYRAILTDLRPKLIRIAAPWSEGEAKPGAYSFHDLDWMMNEATQHETQVLLVVGQKVPRWPECYYPSWADTAAPEAREAFLAYIGAVVARYSGHKALRAWQVENEPFIRFPFGECAKFQDAWVVEEIEQVRLLDPEKDIVVTDSGELGLWWKAARYSDVLGTTIYRFVKTPRGRLWAYDWLPAGWYRFRARVLGKGYDQFIISELQAEPWFTAEGPTDTARSGGANGFSPKRFLAHLEYARHTGASQAYLWGVEWWYFMKEKHGESRYWDIAKSAL